ncbi:hypothetical protein, partial [Delftia acidovorans]|uniref:hypothetical protein n=1 Tax=Delftia acidovorans TaxID=80866 RepID=UPI0030EEBAF7
SSQVCPSSPPPGLIYGGDNYSDAGGIVMRHIFLTFFWSVVTLISLYISTLAGPMFPVTS